MLSHIILSHELDRREVVPTLLQKQRYSQGPGEAAFRKSAEVNR